MISDGYASFSGDLGGLDGQVFTWNSGTGTWNGVPVGNACAGSPIMPGIVYTITLPPPQFIEIELDLPQQKEEVSAGCACKKCKEFNEYASPNQDDKTFICYACLHNL